MLNGIQNRLESVKRRLQSFDLNRAAVYAIASRGWQFLAGPVTVLLIASRFSPEVQGWYYTLASLLALQQLCDLGLPNTLLHTASHAWARLSLASDGSIVGDRDALGELVLIASGGRRWFLVVAAVFLTLALGGGTWYLSWTRTEVAWVGPWITAVCLACGSLLLAVDFAVLEGCGQVATIHRMRLLQAVLSNIVVWSGLWLGAGLWVIPLYAGLRLFLEVSFSRIVNRRFWGALPSRIEDPQALWDRVIWPLQWRAAIHSLMTFLAYQLFVPILFRTSGAEVAGRFGMTWSILTTLQGAASVWVQTRNSSFGVMVRQRQFVELDRTYRRVTRNSLAALVVGVAMVAAGTLGLTVISQVLGEPTDGVRDLTWLIVRLRDRLLDPLPTLLLGLGVIAMHLPQCQTIYLRSFLRDPLLRPAFILNLLMFLLAVFGAVQSGIMGLAVAYLVVSIGGYLPIWFLLWRHFRSQWQSEDVSLSEMTGS